MVGDGDEWLSSFEKALRFEEARVSDPVFEKFNPQYFYNYLYFRSGLYGEQIERYFQWFERDRFLFLTLDHLVADPLSTIRQVWTFLDVDPSVVPIMEVHNKGGGVHSASWQFLLRHRLRPAMSWLRVPLGAKAVSWIMNLNCTNGPAPPMQSQTRKLLQSRYAADLLWTEELTGLDLSAWMSPSASVLQTGRAAA